MGTRENGRKETAPALSVPRRRAEAARAALMERGLLERRLAPRHEDDRVLFPLIRHHLDDEALVELKDRFSARTLHAEFAQRTPREGDYRERLGGLDEALRTHLPRAHDVVGDIAVMKLPEPLLPRKGEIAQALLASHPRLRSVALDRGVAGEERVRGLEVVAGEDRLMTEHREHGLRLMVELDKVYFSPRLATERQELLRRIAPQKRILDLFAGIGAFVCLATRERAPRAVCAVDKNPHAVRLLKRNLEANRLPLEHVQVLAGDARETAPRTTDWDHVVMNLPHDAHRFLDVAAACAAPTGEIHLYAILEREDEAAYLQRALETLEKETGGRWTLAERRHVRQYAPTMDGLRFTLRRA